MARTQKYTEELLLEAVVKYAETGTGKIKATELAGWARKNIHGLEDVRDYHFMRPVKEKDPATGKLSLHQKKCTVRMDEINRARSLTASVSRNALLKASTIEEFMSQPDYVQRRQVVETRETVDKLLVKNESLRRTNDTVRAENHSLREKISLLDAVLEDLQKKQGRLIKQAAYLMKATDEAARKNALAEMGVEDGKIDLDVYTQSLTLQISEAMDLKKILSRYLQKEARQSEVDKDREELPGLTDKILSGIDFQVPK